MGKLIRLFMVDDIPDGMRTMEISNMTVKATIFPRPLLKAFSEREDANKPGVYMLYGDPLEDMAKPVLYIGEGDPVIDRLKNHNANKDFWTEAFVFTSKDGYLTKTQIQYLESRLIALAKEADRVVLDNVQNATEPTISEVDRAEVQQFLESIQVLASALRLRFFEALARTSIIPDASELVYEYVVKEARGLMAIRDGKYVLLSGATARLKHLPSANTAIQKLRDEYIQNGALVDKGNGVLDIAKDIPCDSPSYAAAIVSGGNTNGWISWKRDGKTLRELEFENVEVNI